MFNENLDVVYISRAICRSIAIPTTMKAPPPPPPEPQPEHGGGGGGFVGIGTGSGPPADTTEEADINSNVASTSVLFLIRVALVL